MRVFVILEEEPIPRCKPKDFERNYLRKSFKEKITLLRVIDSRSEQFNLSKAYKDKVKLITIITAPEIEMLIILSENKKKEYDKFRNHHNQAKVYIYDLC